MTETVPNYYHKFRCLAERCMHSCCVGWEIDIDEETLRFYNSLDTKMGETIRNNIEGEVPHFILKQGDRCPFLNENGLCDIICQCGEDALCDICTLHPRFRNFYSSFIETGLGLCCEEAARIVLSEQEKFSVVLPLHCKLKAEEKQFFESRREILDVLQDRKKSIQARFYSLARSFGFSFPFSLDELRTLYLSLERLDERWTDELENLKDFFFDGVIFEEEDFQLPFEQLAVYFIFRHLSRGIWDENFIPIVKFSLMSCWLIGAMCSYYKHKNGSISLEEMVDIVRMYSAEVEYSEDNLETVLNI